SQTNVNICRHLYEDKRQDLVTWSESGGEGRRWRVWEKKRRIGARARYQGGICTRVSSNIDSHSAGMPGTTHWWRFWWRFITTALDRENFARGAELQRRDTDNLSSFS